MMKIEMYKLCKRRCNVDVLKYTMPLTSFIFDKFLSMATPYLFISFFAGITNFDLLGDFGKMDWLGNFYIILSYNLVFAVATALSLVNKFTATVRHEIYIRLGMVFQREKRSWSVTSNGTTPHMKDEWIPPITTNKWNKCICRHFSFCGRGNSTWNCLPKWGLLKKGAYCFPEIKVDSLSLKKDVIS